LIVELYLSWFGLLPAVPITQTIALKVITLIQKQQLEGYCFG